MFFPLDLRFYFRRFALQLPVEVFLDPIDDFVFACAVVINGEKIAACFHRFKRAAVGSQQQLDASGIGGIVRVKTEMFEQSGFDDIFRYCFGRRILFAFPPCRAESFRVKFEFDFSTLPSIR